MIEFQKLCLEYDRKVQALTDITLSIAQGECAFLLGPSGSGKSTMLKLLIRELKATSGRVLLKARDLATLKNSDVPELRRNIGFVPQDILLLPNKKVWENLAYAMRAAGHSAREVRKKVPDALERFGILHRANAFPHELSGGEAQRVAISRALINNPYLLLADEPTGHLDPTTSAEILGVLEDINSRGTTVLMATHDVHTISGKPRRVIRLENGLLKSDTMGLANA